VRTPHSPAYYRQLQASARKTSRRTAVLYTLYLVACGLTIVAVTLCAVLR
jgi:hypothetical protein